MFFACVILCNNLRFLIPFDENFVLFTNVKDLLLFRDCQFFKHVVLNNSSVAEFLNYTLDFFQDLQKYVGKPIVWKPNMPDNC